MKSNRFRTIVLTSSAVLWAAFAFGQTREFTHSKKARLLYFQYDAAMTREQEKFGREQDDLQSKYDKAFQELRETLVAELQKVQDVETKEGHLDAALEIREAITALKSGHTDKLTPADIRSKLVGTVWVHNAETNKGDAYFRFNADGTISTSWHELPSMWSVLPDGTVQMMFTQNRKIRTMRVDATFKSGRGGGSWIYRRIK
jgi:hypothetical protein